MTITTSVGPVLDELRVQLIARPGLSGVGVFTGWVGEDGGDESIQFQTVHVTATWAGMGRRSITEDYDLEGFVWVVRKPGAGETVIKAARDRAEAIWNELLEQIQTDPHIGGLLLMPKSIDRDEDYGIDGNGNRVARVSFKLAFEARISAS
ncbi:MAG TPA: hypothetical protein VND92_08555 [Vicinamibacterales bacterium]|nr:hypothetical protein [Vicinamibacterales bacterium]